MTSETGLIALVESFFVNSCVSILLSQTVKDSTRFIGFSSKSWSKEERESNTFTEIIFYLFGFCAVDGL
jgi:hypothetical protein